MAHFAELDGNNKVTNVIKINNESLDINNEEESGIAFLTKLFGHRKWVQTSFNNNIRKQYAGIEYTYDAVNDVFIKPQPFASWSLDESFDWQPPTPRPEEGYWYWDEDSLSWLEQSL